jgi:hypothetical protein
MMLLARRLPQAAAADRRFEAEANTERLTRIQMD